MIERITECSGIALLLQTVLLLFFGHRLGKTNRAFSMLLVAGVAAIAWWLQLNFTGSAAPFLLALSTSIAVGLPVTFLFPYWNPQGHSSFASVLQLTGVFLYYAGYLFLHLHAGPLIRVCALLLLILQTGTLTLLVAHTFEIIDAICRTRWFRKSSRKIVPGYAPKVSLHVPTHNEPPELVIETLNALSRLDYPNFEVLIIDNNTADENLWRPVEAHCLSLGTRFRFFHLLPWPGYKSGALNFALSRTAPDADIVGVVDADYVVKPNYLADLVGHFDDPRVAFVQTPQDYRDAEERGRYGRALYLAYSYFFEVSMVMRNEYNAIIYAGTMGLIRRSALEQVGGWSEWCITEDAEVSVRILDAGYDSVYVNQSYGRGLMPLDYGGLKKQRFRWAFGGMQLLRLHAGRLLNPWSRGHLTPAQRFGFLSSGLQWLNDPATLIFTFLLMIGSGALIFGRPFFIQPLSGSLFLIPLLFIAFSVTRFLWAFRVRVDCTIRDAWDALTILIGLTWVVALACFQGLVSRHGVFLRTPKQGVQPTFRDTLRVVKWEFGLSVICSLGLLGVSLKHGSGSIWQTLTAMSLLVWQVIVYASAVRSSFWVYIGERRSALPGQEKVLQVPPESENRLSPGWCVAAVVVFPLVLILYLTFLQQLNQIHAKHISSVGVIIRPSGPASVVSPTDSTASPLIPCRPAETDLPAEAAPTSFAPGSSTVRERVFRKQVSLRAAKDTNASSSDGRQLSDSNQCLHESNDTTHGTLPRGKGEQQP